MTERTYTQEEFDSLVEKTVTRRVREANVEAWAKGINGAMVSHTKAIEELERQLSKFLTDAPLFVRLEPEDQEALTELIEASRVQGEQQVQRKERDQWWQNRIIRVGIYVTVGSQVAAGIAGVANFVYTLLK